ncbi:unnamed protein product [Taenia asiatica]|uniref:Amino acid transporter n=1 Tax=Taenia asiatica TaxID=60517 RepID=A0A0R3W1Q8_TAEAS|nr:unnamed protein product [Taenia asiatica]
MADKYADEEGLSTVDKTPSTCYAKFKKGLKDNLFTILTLIGVIIGFGIGFGVGKVKPSETAVTWIGNISTVSVNQRENSILVIITESKFLLHLPLKSVFYYPAMPGKIYIRLLQLTILPVVAANIIVVMGRIDPRKNGKMGLAALLFVFCFDIISGAVGVIMAVLIKPGVSTSIAINQTVEEPGPDDAPVSTSDVFADLFMNVFPDNIVGLTLYQTKTIRRWPYFPVKNETKSVQIKLESTDMIGLIFTTISFGIAAGAAGEGGKAFIDFFESLGNTVLILMRWFLQLTPVGVCFMIAGAIVGVDDVSKTFQGLGLFMATVLAALAVHMIMQMVVYTIASFRNPFRLMWMGFRVFFLSFITTSPLIAIPDMIETCDRYGLQKKISRFVIPLSAALKGDASGVFQAVACVFIAQLTGYNLTAGTYVIIADRCRSGSLGLGHLFAAAFTHSVAVGRRTEGKVDEEEEFDDSEEDEYKTEKSE